MGSGEKVVGMDTMLVVGQAGSYLKEQTSCWSVVGVSSPWFNVIYAVLDK